MPINLKATGVTLSTAALIADSVKVTGGSTDAVPTLTQVGGQPIAAALEVQSTLGAFVLPRMTTVQKNALAPVVAGMKVFDTDLNSESTYANDGWSDGGSMVATVNLTAANIIAMNGAAVQVIAAPGAGKIIIVNRFAISFTAGATPFTGGGTGIALQYGATAYTAGNLATELVNAAVINVNTNNFAVGAGHAISGATPLTTAAVTNALVCITCQTAFAAGNGTAVVKVWYTIVNAF